MIIYRKFTLHMFLDMFYSEIKKKTLFESVRGSIMGGENHGKIMENQF